MRAQKAMQLAPVLAGAILITGLLRVPVAHPHLMARAAQQYMAEVAIALVVAGLVFHGANRWVGLLMASAFISVYHPMYDVVSAMAMLQWSLMGVWYYACFKVGENETVLDVICIVALLHYGFSLLQLYLAGSLYSLPKGIPACGMMTNPNEAAALAAIAFPAFCRTTKPCLRVGQRTFSFPVAWFWGAPLIIHSIILSKSFGAALALCAGLAWWAWINGHKKMVLVFLASAAAYLLIDRPESQGLRLAAWTVAWHILKQFPWFGVGLGHWPSTFPYVEHLYWDSAHNDYVQLIYEHGFKALPFLLGFIITLLYRAHKWRFDLNVQRLNMAVIICLVSASYHWLFQNGTTAVIGVAYLAMLDKETKDAA